LILSSLHGFGRVQRSFGRDISDRRHEKAGRWEGFRDPRKPGETITLSADAEHVHLFDGGA
jgi:hypothetical protein